MKRKNKKEDDGDIEVGEDIEPKGKVPKLSEKIIRDDITPKHFDSFVPLTFLSWNVNGFKALLTKKFPVLKDMIEKRNPALFCLQETKLQTEAAAEYR